MPFGLRRSTLYVGEIWFWKRRMFTWLYWLYVLLNNIWIGACAVVYYKWGDIVLGANQSDTKRDLSDLTWMLTMFTTGMGIALLYFGVSEPIYNLEAALSQDTTYNDASQHAFLITYLHFGLHAWAPFVLVGVMLGLAHHRHGLPLTMPLALYMHKVTQLSQHLDVFERLDGALPPHKQGRQCIAGCSCPSASVSCGWPSLAAAV